MAESAEGVCWRSETEMALVGKLSRLAETMAVAGWCAKAIRGPDPRVAVGLLAAFAVRKKLSATKQ